MFNNYIINFLISLLHRAPGRPGGGDHRDLGVERTRTLKSGMPSFTILIQSLHSTCAQQSQHSDSIRGPQAGVARPQRRSPARAGSASYQLDRTSCQVDVDQELYGLTSTGPVVVTTCQGSASKLLGTRR